MPRRKGDRNRQRERQDEAAARQAAADQRNPTDQLTRLVDRDAIGCKEWDRLMDKVAGKEEK